MPTTKYDGHTGAVKIAAHYDAVLAPAVLDLAAPKVAEIEAGTSFTCSTRLVEIAGTSTSTSDQWLCDADTVETPGAVTWTGQPIVIQAGPPQTPNTFISGLTSGAVRYLIERRGLAPTAAYTSSQIVSVAEIEISHWEHVAAEANTEGRKWEYRIHYTVRRYRQVATVAT